MTATTVPRTAWGVKLGTNLIGGLTLAGAGLMMLLANWPGLIKLAGFVAAAAAFVASENWRHPERMKAATPFVMFTTVPAAALVALMWPLAMPGERLLTVALVAGTSVTYCVASVLAWRYAPRGR
jgi:hypothetical protein